MERLQSAKSLILFHIILNCIVVVFITGASYYHTPLLGGKDFAIYFLHLCLLQTTVAGILYFLSVNRWVFYSVFSILFLVYCGFSFWAYTQDVSVTLPLIQSVLETKADIAIDLITIPFALFIVISMGALFYIFKFHSKIEPINNFKYFVVPALLCIGLYFFIEQKRPGSLKNRLPYTLVFSFQQYFEKPTLLLNTVINAAETETDSLKVIFVLGETVRADHLGINGYERNTTPKLANQKNLISYANLYTKHTYTGVSVPQILTNETLEGKTNQLVSVYSVANKANYKTTWIGNQTLEKSFQPIVETNNEIVLVDKYKSEFSFGKKRDEAMLPVLDSILPMHHKQFITLHMIGSHWWYENRYTQAQRVFTPVIKTKYIPSINREEMINSYDNTIVYLDSFINTIIQKLKQENTPSVVVYVSDHGELLGENGHYLHAQEGEALHNPAFFVWFSDEYISKYPEQYKECLQLKNADITTDIIFQFVLNILDISYN